MVKQHNIIHEYTIKEFNCGRNRMGQSVCR